MGIAVMKVGLSTANLRDEDEWVPLTRVALSPPAQAGREWLRESSVSGRAVHEIDSL
ncbi:MAG: hypothetical protein IGQ88_09900 [Gloeomargaritaceae cyanobacterium C42_A2020_066]|nr:hypothetical protein [Gloeomargaritaceae cyanobacterium C42_A2020_066]